MSPTSQQLPKTEFTRRRQLRSFASRHSQAVLLVVVQKYCDKGNPKFPQDHFNPSCLWTNCVDYVSYKSPDITVSIWYTWLNPKSPCWQVAGKVLLIITAMRGRCLRSTLSWGEARTALPAVVICILLCILCSAMMTRLCLMMYITFFTHKFNSVVFIIK